MSKFLRVRLCMLLLLSLRLSAGYKVVAADAGPGGGFVMADTPPSMTVKGGSADIENGDMTPSPSDFTDMGSLLVGGETNQSTFTIYNYGESLLELTGTPRVAISGEGAGSFHVTATPAASVARNFPVQFGITFDPVTTGRLSAVVSIPNNDPHNNPFTFAVAGIGRAPEIDVQGNSVSIADGDDTASLVDHTDFGAVRTGGIGLRTFTICNTGGSTLHLSGSPLVSVSGPDAARFSVNPQPAASVGSVPVTFDVYFTPSSTGLFWAVLSIANDDEDESPYNFRIQGTGTAAGMDVRGNSVSIAPGDDTPSPVDHTDFGFVPVADASRVRTFAIHNTGAATLYLLGNPRVAVGGAYAAEFVVSNQPAQTVAPGDSTTFDVAFDPAGQDLRSATLSIASDDTNHNPYVFSIQGHGTRPEIDVQCNAITIEDGDPLSSLEDGTDFGSATLTGAPVAHTFTIRNLGLAPLHLTGYPRVRLTTWPDTEFTVTLQPDAEIAPLSSTTFEITFAPYATRLFAAAVAIDNDDGNEDPYSFSISGRGVDPEMDVQGNSFSIPNGTAVPNQANGTDFGHVVAVSGAVTRIFTILNSGSGTLNLTGTPAVAVSGAQAADFTVTKQPSASVAESGSTTFKVTFDPSETGVRMATLSIANDDGNENPYHFSIQGYGTAPDVDVQGNSISIPDGDATPSAVDNTDFGLVRVSGALFRARSFTILNTGVGPLRLTGDPPVAVVGSNAAEFAVSSQPETSIDGGGSVSFEVVFDPVALGPRTAVLRITSDDADESPYTFAIQGTGQGPRIEIRGNAVAIANGDDMPSLADHTDFGFLPAASGTVTRTFTITNSGNETLSLGGSPLVAVGGPQASDFRVSVLPAPSVAAGQATTFSVTFDPGAVGLREATLSVLSDDSDGSPYTFAIQGHGTRPEIDVTGNGKSIEDGDHAPSLADHTAFGYALVSGGAVTRLFAIRNLGLAPLHLAGDPPVDVLGPEAAEFAVTLQPTTPIAFGEAAVFAVTFNPASIGGRTAIVRIANDDEDESVYTFSVEGTGTFAPIMASPLAGPNGAMLVRWLSLTNHLYAVQETTNLQSGWSFLHRGIPGQAPMNVYTAGMGGSAAKFWKVVTDE